ncbi:uncharacterized protein LOC142317398 [Lycorma delicatula]|uniref:uncharacterized protein LOC142317398 n=1 Tax=Lycorma delicatula TaxID=130591 RepID=UPI003F511362
MMSGKSQEAVEGRKKIGCLQVDGKNYDLFTGKNTIGSDDSCTVVLKSKAISNQHAVISVDDPSFPMLCDKGSKYKTKLGKTVLEPNRIYCFPDNAKITFGNVKATYVKNPDEDEDDEEEEDFFLNASQSQVHETDDVTATASTTEEGPSTSNKHENSEPVDAERTPVKNDDKPVIIEESPDSKPAASVFEDTLVENYDDDDDPKLEQQPVGEKNHHLHDYNEDLCSAETQNIDGSYEFIDETATYIGVPPHNSNKNSEAKPKQNSVQPLIIEQSINESNNCENSFNDKARISDVIQIDTSAESETCIRKSENSVENESITKMKDDMYNDSDSFHLFLEGTQIMESSVDSNANDFVDCSITPINGSIEKPNHNASSEDADKKKRDKETKTSSNLGNCTKENIESKNKSLNRIDKTVLSCDKMEVTHVLTSQLITDQTNFQNITMDITKENVTEEVEDKESNLKVGSTCSVAGLQINASSDDIEGLTSSSNISETNSKITEQKSCLASEKYIDSNPSKPVSVVTSVNRISEGGEAEILNSETEKIHCKTMRAPLECNDIETEHSNEIETNHDLSRLTAGKLNKIEKQKQIEVCDIKSEKNTENSNFNDLQSKLTSSKKLKKSCEIKDQSYDSDTDEDIDFLVAQKIGNTKTSLCKRIPLDDTDNTVVQNNAATSSSEKLKSGSEIAVQSDANDVDSDVNLLSTQKINKAGVISSKGSQFHDAVNIEANNPKPSASSTLGRDIKKSSEVGEQSDDSDTDEDIGNFAAQKITTSKTSQCKRTPLDDAGNTNMQNSSKISASISNRRFKSGSEVTIQSDSDTDDDICLLPTQKISNAGVVSCERMPLCDTDDADLNGSKPSVCTSDRELIKSSDIVDQSDGSDTDEDIGLLATQKITTTETSQCKRIPIYDTDDAELNGSKPSVCTSGIEINKSSEIVDQSDGSDTDEDIGFLATQKITATETSQCKRVPLDDTANTNIQNSIETPASLSSRKLKSGSEIAVQSDSDPDEDISLLATQEFNIAEVVTCKRIPLQDTSNTEVNVSKQSASTLGRKLKKSSDIVKQSSDGSDTDEDIGVLATQKLTTTKTSQCKRVPLDDTANTNIQKSTEASVSLSSRKFKSSSEIAVQSDSDPDEDISLLATQEFNIAEVVTCKKIPSQDTGSTELNISKPSASTLGRELKKSCDIVKQSSDGSDTDEDIGVLATQKLTTTKTSQCKRVPLDDTTNTNIQNSTETSVSLSSRKFKSSSEIEVQSDSDTDEDINLLATEEINIAEVVTCKRIPLPDTSNTEVNVSKQSASTLGRKLKKSSDIVKQSSDGSDTDEDIGVLATQKITATETSQCKRVPLDDTANTNIQNSIETPASLSSRKLKSGSEIAVQSDSDPDEDISLLATQEFNIAEVVTCKRIPLQDTGSTELNISKPSASTLGRELKKSCDIVKQSSDGSDTDEDIGVLATQKLTTTKTSQCKRVPLDDTANTNIQKSTEASVSLSSRKFKSSSKIDVQSDSDTDEDINLLATEETNIAEVVTCKRIPLPDTSNTEVNSKQSASTLGRKLKKSLDIVKQSSDGSDTDEDIGVLATQKLTTTKTSQCKRVPLDDTANTNIQNSTETSVSLSSRKFKSNSDIEVQSDSNTDEYINLLSIEKIPTTETSHCIPIDDSVNTNIQNTAETSVLASDKKLKRNSEIANQSGSSDTDEEIDLNATQKITTNATSVCRRIPIDDTINKTLQDINVSLSNTPGKNLREYHKITNHLEKSVNNEYNDLPTQKISTGIPQCKRIVIDDSVKINIQNSAKSCTASVSRKKLKISSGRVVQSDDSDTDEDIRSLATQKITTTESSLCKRMPIDETETVNTQFESAEFPTFQSCKKSKCSEIVVQSDGNELDEVNSTISTQKITIASSLCERMEFDGNVNTKVGNFAPVSASSNKLNRSCEIADRSDGTETDGHFPATNNVTTNEKKICNIEKCGERKTDGFAVSNLSETPVSSSRFNEHPENSPLAIDCKTDNIDEGIVNCSTQKRICSKTKACKQIPIDDNFISSKSDIIKAETSVSNTPATIVTDDLSVSKKGCSVECNDGIKRFDNQKSTVSDTTVDSLPDQENHQSHISENNGKDVSVLTDSANSNINAKNQTVRLNTKFVRVNKSSSELKLDELSVNYDRSHNVTENTDKSNSRKEINATEQVDAEFDESRSGDALPLLSSVKCEGPSSQSQTYPLSNGSYTDQDEAHSILKVEDPLIKEEVNAFSSFISSTDVCRDLVETVCENSCDNDKMDCLVEINTRLKSEKQNNSNPSSNSVNKDSSHIEIEERRNSESSEVDCGSSDQSFSTGITLYRNSFPTIDEDEIENDNYLQEVGALIEDKNPLIATSPGRLKRKRTPTQKVKDMSDKSQSKYSCDLRNIDKAKNRETGIISTSDTSLKRTNAKKMARKKTDIEKSNLKEQAETFLSEIDSKDPKISNDTKCRNKPMTLFVNKTNRNRTKSNTKLNELSVKKKSVKSINNEVKECASLINPDIFKVVTSVVEAVHEEHNENKSKSIKSKQHMASEEENKSILPAKRNEKTIHSNDLLSVEECVPQTCGISTGIRKKELEIQLGNNVDVSDVKINSEKKIKKKVKVGVHLTSTESNENLTSGKISEAAEQVFLNTVQNSIESRKTRSWQKKYKTDNVHCNTTLSDISESSLAQSVVKSNIDKKLKACENDSCEDKIKFQRKDSVKLSEFTVKLQECSTASAGNKTAVVKVPVVNISDSVGIDFEMGSEQNEMDVQFTETSNTRKEKRNKQNSLAELASEGDVQSSSSLVDKVNSSSTKLDRDNSGESTKTRKQVLSDSITGEMISKKQKPSSDIIEGKNSNEIDNDSTSERIKTRKQTLSDDIVDEEKVIEVHSGCITGGMKTRKQKLNSDNTEVKNSVETNSDSTFECSKTKKQKLSDKEEKLSELHSSGISGGMITRKQKPSSDITEVKNSVEIDNDSTSECIKKQTLSEDVVEEEKLSEVRSSGITGGMKTRKQKLNSDTTEVKNSVKTSSDISSECSKTKKQKLSDDIVKEEKLSEVHSGSITGGMKTRKQKQSSDTTEVKNSVENDNDSTFEVIRPKKQKLSDDDIVKDEKVNKVYSVNVTGRMKTRKQKQISDSTDVKNPVEVNNDRTSECIKKHTSSGDIIEEEKLSEVQGSSITGGMKTRKEKPNSGTTEVKNLVETNSDSTSDYSKTKKQKLSDDVVKEEKLSEIHNDDITDMMKTRKQKPSSDTAQVKVSVEIENDSTSECIKKQTLSGDIVEEEKLVEVQRSGITGGMKTRKQKLNSDVANVENLVETNSDSISECIKTKKQKLSDDIVKEEKLNKVRSSSITGRMKTRKLKLSSDTTEGRNSLEVDSDNASDFIKTKKQKLNAGKENANKVEISNNMDDVKTQEKKLNCDLTDGKITNEEDIVNSGRNIKTRKQKISAFSAEEKGSAMSSNVDITDVTVRNSKQMQNANSDEEKSICIVNKGDFTDGIVKAGEQKVTADDVTEEKNVCEIGNCSSSRSTKTRNQSRSNDSTDRNVRPSKRKKSFDLSKEIVTNITSDSAEEQNASETDSNSSGMSMKTRKQNQNASVTEGKITDKSIDYIRYSNTRKRKQKPTPVVSDEKILISTDSVEKEHKNKKPCLKTGTLDVFSGTDTDKSSTFDQNAQNSSINNDGQKSYRNKKIVSGNKIKLDVQNNMVQVEIPAEEKSETVIDSEGQELENFRKKFDEKIVKEKSLDSDKNNIRKSPRHKKILDINKDQQYNIPNDYNVLQLENNQSVNEEIDFYHKSPKRRARSAAVSSNFALKRNQKKIEVNKVIISPENIDPVDNVALTSEGVLNEKMDLVHAISKNTDENSKRKYTRKTSKLSLNTLQILKKDDSSMSISSVGIDDLIDSYSISNSEQNNSTITSTDSSTSSKSVRRMKSNKNVNKLENKKNSDVNSSSDNSEIIVKKYVRRSRTNKECTGSGDEDVTTASETLTPRNSVTRSSLTPSSGRLRRKIKMKENVLFTYVSDEEYISMVSKLGGKVVESPDDCSVLVTDKVRRTIKFLCVLSMGKPIVSLKWITDSNKAGCFLDPWRYLVNDKEAEKKFSFRLADSLKEAQQNLMLDGFKIFSTPSVKPSPEEMKSIVICSGGEFIDKEPRKWPEQTVIISCEEDKSLWTKYKKRKFLVPIVSAEAVLTGVLRQSFKLEDYQI